MRPELFDPFSQTTDEFAHRPPGETIPIRLFLGGFELTPTFRDVNKKFSTRYYLNLVLIDEENRRYFKCVPLRSLPFLSATHGGTDTDNKRSRCTATEKASKVSRPPPLPPNRTPILPKPPPPLRPPPKPPSRLLRLNSRSSSTSRDSRSRLRCRPLRRVRRCRRRRSSRRSICSPLL